MKNVMKLDEYKKIKKRPKYGNKKTGKNDSKKESLRAADLHLQEKLGIIHDLQEQVKFELIPAQYEIINGKRVCIERACNYIADLVYIKDGELVVEDPKGLRTKDYIIKRKLMLKEHGIKILET